jgi:hypothetical protein
MTPLGEAAPKRLAKRAKLNQAVVAAGDAPADELFALEIELAAIEAQACVAA